MENILQIEHVNKTYSGHQALTDVSLNVPKGKVYGLLGPNGAGKTTLIRIINHITAPDSGQVLFNGHRLTADDVPNIGYLPEERGLYKKMKVGDQAMFFARLKGMSKTQAHKALKQWFEHLEISDWWNKRVEELSKGMAQKVQFIVTVLHRPQLLIFDEPFSGFDPINANMLKHEILKLRDQGATVIFSTHNMASVEELCDNITLINNSHNILTGPVDEVRRRFSDNSYELSFTGNADELNVALTDKIKTLKSLESGRDGLHSMKFNLESAETVRKIIATANNLVNIVSFNRILSSMDEIFIRAVEASNSTTPPSNPE